MMTIDSPRKKVLILSDNDRLSRAIELNLKTAELFPNGDLQIIKLSPDDIRMQAGSSGCNGLDLIMIALSSPVSEPLLFLAKASVASEVGRVPLLIISDRPFEAQPVEKISHLDFPFDIDVLRSKVKAALSSPP